VIYHRGERGGCKSFLTVFNLLRGFAHSAATALPSTLALEYKGMAISLEQSTVPRYPIFSLSNDNARPRPGVERVRPTYRAQQHQSSDQYIIPCAGVMMGGVARTFPLPV